MASGLLAHAGQSIADHGSLGFGIGVASPIITQTGVTLPQGMWAAGTIISFTSFDSASDAKLVRYQANHGDVHSVNTLLVPSIFGAYGVTDDLTLGLRIPWVIRSGIKSPTEDGDVLRQGNPDGLGDISVFGQYRFFHTADNLNQLSLVAALKTPTGKTSSNTNQGDTFEAHHQPRFGFMGPLGRVELYQSHGELVL